ncbi:hypothetical protein AMS68_001137 [Peltaster fructicola]|uniref:Type I phosphodiesterase/nucleotide pyrophosphatase n=1 Tax=Peltaster fructicola TaxID=286661 RepID=A0A6H0XM94_9PEZI|nr:hypothetical protein AMS68_001137 [Peltaster fructicola]
MSFSKIALISALAATAAALPQWGGWQGNASWQGFHDENAYDCRQNPFKRVVSFSIDGLHASDVEKWLAYKPSSNISALLKTGYEYTNAYTSAPSDSFPGTCAFYTGATPKTTGVWYDDVWDRSLYDPKDTACASAGAEIVYDESIDYNSSAVFSGGINPANLPRAKVNGKCVPLYPHSRIRVNTLFEVAVNHGLVTAYTDKHPSYDLVRGPSGKGLTVGYFPEINAYSTQNLSAIIEYDTFHVNAWLEWLDGQTPANSEGSLGGKIPSLFGGNFQAVSVAQKTFGYANDSASSFSPQLITALTFVDNSLGLIINKLKAKGMYDETLIAVASKHGQAPIKRSLYNKVDPLVITNATGVAVDFQTSDDIALIFLHNQADLQKAVDGLNAHRTQGKIRAVIYGQNLTASGFGDPTKDPAVPDIIVQPELGTIYTTSTKKIAEHGGISGDDRIVAAFVSNPRLQARKFAQQVFTTQFAPTVLEALNLPVHELQGAQQERTQMLPGFTGQRQW